MTTTTPRGIEPSAEMALTSRLEAFDVFEDNLLEVVALGMDLLGLSAPPSGFIEVNASVMARAAGSSKRSGHDLAVRAMQGGHDG